MITENTIKSVERTGKIYTSSDGCFFQLYTVWVTGEIEKNKFLALLEEEHDVCSYGTGSDYDCSGRDFGSKPEIIEWEECYGYYLIKQWIGVDV